MENIMLRAMECKKKKTIQALYKDIDQFFSILLDGEHLL